MFTDDEINDTLYGKNRWTGEELGRLEVSNMLYLLDASLRRESEIFPLFNSHDFLKRAGTLQGKELDTYHGYLDVHNWFTRNYYNSVAGKMEASLCLERLSNTLFNASISERAICCLDTRPAFMTMDQYKKTDTCGNLPPFGISILRTEDEADWEECINPETGYYDLPNARDLLSMISLDSFLPENPDSETNIKSLSDSRALFYDNYYFLQGWNIALTLTGEFCKVDDFSVAVVDLTNYHTMVDSFNNAQNTLLHTLMDMPTFFPDRDKKIEILDECFMPLSLDDLKTPESAILKAKNDIKKFAAFRDPNKDLIETLCYRN